MSDLRDLRCEGCGRELCDCPSTLDDVGDADYDLEPCAVCGVLCLVSEVVCSACDERLRQEASEAAFQEAVGELLGELELAPYDRLRLLSVLTAP